MRDNGARVLERGPSMAGRAAPIKLQLSPQKTPTAADMSLATHPKDQEEAQQSLTGRILQTDTHAEDFVQQQQPKHGWNLNKRSALELAAVVGLVGLLATVIALAVTLSRSYSSRDTGIDPACIHALGGGPIKSGGSLDTTGTAPDYCKEQLRSYADSTRGSYWREVDLAMLAAMATFGFAHHSVGPTQQQAHWQQQQHQHQPVAGVATHAQKQQGLGSSTTSKLSRSLLSTAASEQPAAARSARLMLGGPVAAAAQQQGVLQAPQPGRDKVVVFDIDETVLSNMPQIMDPVTWTWDKWVAAAQAPALQPSLRFYRALCQAGYSVAFITGRKEASRASTMRNLEAEGYGKPCGSGPGPFYGARPLGEDGGAGECCYSALYLRQAGDTSLASVYKPGARADLVRQGNMTLVALVGDQFSDLNGELAAPYAFKLPNPFYYIL